MRVFENWLRWWWFRITNPMNQYGSKWWWKTSWKLLSVPRRRVKGPLLAKWYNCSKQYNPASRDALVRRMRKAMKNMEWNAPMEKPRPNPACGEFKEKE